MGREPRVVIIGAGVAGIATAVTLQRVGFHDFTILEKGTDVGGVWHWNRYPGLTCDVPHGRHRHAAEPADPRLAAAVQTSSRVGLTTGRLERATRSW